MSGRARARRDAAGAWAIAVGLMAAFFWVSHQPRVPLPVFAQSDKLAHGAAYAVLATAWYAALRCTWPWADYRRHAWLAGVAAALYGATDEWHQAFVPGRAASLADWVADAAGAMVVATLAALIKRARVEPDA